MLITSLSVPGTHLECQPRPYGDLWNKVHNAYIIWTGIELFHNRGSFNNYVDKMREGGGQKMSVFVHAQGIKTVDAGMGGGAKNGKNLST